MIPELQEDHVSVQHRQIMLESVDDRMIALMRLTLAVSALLIIYIDPSEPDRFVVPTYGALVIYVVYSTIILALSFYQHTPHSVVPWIDVSCYLVIVSMSSGTNSIFFFFFFFPILVASFRSGFKQGILITLASSLLFTIVGAVSAPGPQFELNRFLLRPVYLLVLGYMMAYWGGREIRLKRRLTLLRQINHLANPRFGASYTIASMLAKLRAFYDARGCLMVLTDPVYKDTNMYGLERGQSPETIRPDPVSPRLEELLLSFPDNIAVSHRVSFGPGVFPHAKNMALDLTHHRKCTGEWEGLIESIAAKLEFRAFISVPLRYRGKPIGRLYLSEPRESFGATEIDFLIQIVEQMIPVVHNISLLSRLASNTAEQERQRLARDLHDSVIQPYLGLQYKLAAIRNKIAEGLPANEEIDRLFGVTVNEIKTLRGFVRGLREGEQSEANFVAAVRRFAAQFSDSYDLDVEVESQGDIEVNDSCAVQLVRIVQEGLSNVRKHTNASKCRIILQRADAMLRLTIENDNPSNNGGGKQMFVPRSIFERSEDLGGHASVEQRLDGRTAVTVEIPL